MTTRVSPRNFKQALSLSFLVGKLKMKSFKDGELRTSKVSPPAPDSRQMMEKVDESAGPATARKEQQTTSHVPPTEQQHYDSAARKKTPQPAEQILEDAHKNPTASVAPTLPQKWRSRGTSVDTSTGSSSSTHRHSPNAGEYIAGANMPHPAHATSQAALLHLHPDQLPPLLPTPPCAYRTPLPRPTSYHPSLSSQFYSLPMKHNMPPTHSPHSNSPYFPQTALWPDSLSFYAPAPQLSSPSTPLPYVATPLQPSPLPLTMSAPHHRPQDRFTSILGGPPPPPPPLGIPPQHLLGAPLLQQQPLSPPPLVQQHLQQQQRSPPALQHYQQQQPPPPGLS
ncbi:hypothetical protein L7F22_007248 [Adiantum nelumboides]|nr:hypothetical protein [Adiantum nelumboides]